MSSSKAIYWEEQNFLIVSDVHLGKAGHFRKSGVAVPSAIHLGDLSKLSKLINTYQPAQVIFLGDLFHSDYNIDWDYFCAWVKRYQEIDFVLVRGNHDVLYKLDYLHAGLHLVEELQVGGFSLTHEQVESTLYNLSGHVHPAVRLVGAGRQALQLPCFYFGEKFGLLPAFGEFTGFAKLTPKRGDHIFVIADEEVVKV